MNTILVALISGVSAAVIGVIGNIIINRLNRKDKKEDKQEDKQAAADARLTAINNGLKLLMLDKIKYLGLRFISEGGITYEDRSLLHRMHDNYHNELGGNGDLDQIMDDVDKLPLKKSR